VGQDTALEERTQLAFDEPRHRAVAAWPGSFRAARRRRRRGRSLPDRAGGRRPMTRKRRALDPNPADNTVRHRSPLRRPPRSNRNSTNCRVARVSEIFSASPEIAERLRTRRAPAGGPPVSTYSIAGDAARRQRASQRVGLAWARRSDVSVCERKSCPGTLTKGNQLSVAELSRTGFAQSRRQRTSGLGLHERLASGLGSSTSTVVGGRNCRNTLAFFQDVVNRTNLNIPSG
jgi:hypothetical protein